MGKIIKSALFIGLLLSLGITGWAKEKSTVAILPFSVSSAENIDYVQQGIWDMLTSRISVDNKIEAINKDIVLTNLKESAKKELTLADIYGLGKKINVDFIVWGSITKIGNNVSIDGKLVDVNTYKSPVGIFVQSQGLDEIIPKINDFAQRISNHITGNNAALVAGLPAAAPVQEPSSPQAVREKEIIAGMRASKKGTVTAIPLNTDFINSPQSLDKKGFWMSQQFGTTFKGMDMGDVNGDGLNEVVVIDSSNVMIYQKKGATLTLVQQLPGKTYKNYLSVDVADINNNGVKEIIVTSITRNVLESFVLEWREGKFAEIASNLPWFLRVIRDSTDSNILLGQRMGLDAPFNSPIQEIIWDGKQYQADRKMKIPEGLAVFGLALDTIETRGAEKVIAFNEDDYLVIYNKTDKPLAKIHVLGGSKEMTWKSEDQFGGSNNAFSLSVSTSFTEYPGRYFVNPRITTFDTNKDGKKELIVVKNISATGRAFKNTTLFNASEIYNLEWDGLGLSENWRTGKINGYVADYQFKDIDNDGQNEVVLALVLSVGVTFQEKSVIVAYKLTPQVGPTSK
jgi:TolB-like protein